jgi:hypothetical protein
VQLTEWCKEIHIVPGELNAKESHYHRDLERQSSPEGWSEICWMNRSLHNKKKQEDGSEQNR